MKKINILLTFVALFIGANLLLSQTVVSYTAGPTNAQINASIIGDNVILSGGTLNYGTRASQIATFTGGTAAGLSMNGGAFFGTGLVANLLTTNTLVNNSNTITSVTYSDADLISVDSEAIHDVVSYSFSITLGPKASVLLIKYQFGSEEFPDYVGSHYDDAFGFFVTGPGITGSANLAKLPNGSPTSINKVNYGIPGYSTDSPVDAAYDGSQSAYYTNNGHLVTTRVNGAGVTTLTQNNNTGTKPIAVQFNAVTKLLTYSLSGLTPGGTYTFKVVIADTADTLYDSGVFINTIYATANVVANNDTQNINPGKIGTVSVLNNDTVNGASPASLTDVSLSQISTTNSGVNLDPTTGLISVTPSTPAGVYTIQYQICDNTYTLNCKTATATITVTNVDTDGDGIGDALDLDSDNDGILDIFECPNSVVDTTFSSTNGTVTTFSAPAADLGFIFDVYTLDNSFNLKINGVNLSASELQFQADQVATVRFLDGSIYGSGGVPEIYNMTGTASKPLVRIIIDKNGYVTMYGSKASEGNLYPLQLYNGNSFNTTLWNQVGANTVELTQIVHGATYITGRGNGVKNGFCDPDNDGVSNQYDVDSDGDGCPDAIEGSETVKYDQVHSLSLLSTDANYAYRGQIKVLADGVTTGTPVQVVSKLARANGVPELVNNSVNNTSGNVGVADNTDGTVDVGQGVGDSQNASVNSCICYKPTVITGTVLDTTHGITSLNRAGTSTSTWPQVRKGAWTALESKTKGFVPNRLTTAQISAIPVGNLIEGMMVYNTTLDCLQINTNGTASGWKCFNTQTCADIN